MESKNTTSTILTFRITYKAKQELIKIADLATTQYKNQGFNKNITVSDVIKNAIEQVYGVSCGA